jgi:hypothetical protein
MRSQDPQEEYPYTAIWDVSVSAGKLHYVCGKFCQYDTDYSILTAITVGFKNKLHHKIYLLIMTNDIQNNST